MAIAVSLKGIDEAISNLNYKNPEALKSRLVDVMRGYYQDESSIESLHKLDAVELIKVLWDTGDDDDLIKDKRKNLSSTKSGVNSDLKKLFKEGKNSEGVMIGRNNVFEMSDQAKDQILSALGASAKGGTGATLRHISEVLRNVQDILSEAESVLGTQGSDGLNKLEELRSVIQGLAEEVETAEGAEDGEEAEVVEEVLTGEDEEIEEVEETDEDEFVDVLEELDDEEGDIEYEDVDSLERADEEEGLEEELGEGDVEEIEEDDTEMVEEVLTDEDEDLEEIVEDELEGALEEVEIDDELEDAGAYEDMDEAGVAEGLEADEVEVEDGLDEAEADEDLEEVVDVEEGLEEAEAEEGLEDDEVEEGLEEVEVEDGLDEAEADEDLEEVEVEGGLAGAEVGDGDGGGGEEGGLPVGSLGEESPGIGDDEAEKARLLAETFDGYLGAMERYHNQHIFIPAGPYIVGSKAPKRNERPEQRVQVTPFYLSKFPVINALFEIFDEKTGYKTTAERQGYSTVYYGRVHEGVDGRTGQVKLTFRATVRSETVSGACWYQPFGPGSNLYGKRIHPVVHISMEDAIAFAAWTGKRLPTENEWEAGARTASGHALPWGPEHKSNACNIEDSAVSDTTPVDKYAEFKNDLGIVDTLGNVLEWTLDTCESTYDGNNNRIYQVVKGGSWVSENTIRAFSRFKMDPASSSNIVGFRCVAY